MLPSIEVEMSASDISPSILCFLFSMIKCATRKRKSQIEALLQAGLAMIRKLCLECSLSRSASPTHAMGNRRQETGKVTHAALNLPGSVAADGSLGNKSKVIM